MMSSSKITDFYIAIGTDNHRIFDITKTIDAPSAIKKAYGKKLGGQILKDLEKRI
jgi:hypothetical protein